MQRGTSYRLSGEILNLKCVSNLLSSINDPDQGLELENLKRSASYGCLCYFIASCINIWDEKHAASSLVGSGPPGQGTDSWRAR